MNGVINMEKTIIRHKFTLENNRYNLHKKIVMVCDYEENWDDTYVTLKFLQDVNHQLIRDVLKKYKNADKIFIKDSAIFGNTSFEDHELPTLTRVTFENCKFGNLGTRCKISSCDFINCEFFEVRFDEIEYSKFKNCIFNETHAWDIDEVNHCDFLDCSFIGKEYGYRFPLKIVSCTYLDCKIEKCKMGKRIETVNFINCNLIDVNFSYCDVDYVTIDNSLIKRVYFADSRNLKNIFINGYGCAFFNYDRNNFVFIPALGIVQHNSEYFEEIYPDSKKFEFNVKDFDIFIQEHYTAPKKFRGKNLAEYINHMNYHFVKSLQQQIEVLYKEHLKLKKVFDER